MNNFYYYSFYLLSMFSNKVNKKNGDYAFSGMAYLSLLVSSNIFTMLAVLELRGIIKIKGTFLYIAVAVSVLIINYFFLMTDNKSALIIEFYQQRRLGKVYDAAFYIYVLLSLISCGCTAYLVRNIRG
jgi:hypothetical protein